jgi:hypothetical protein
MVTAGTNERKKTNTSPMIEIAVVAATIKAKMISTNVSAPIVPR